MAVHTGKRPADLPDDMNPNDVSDFWISWADVLNGYTMQTSNWVLPDGFNEIATEFNKPSRPDEDGNVFPNSNAILISTTETGGTYYIGNRMRKK